ncbi:DUF2931 family protein [Flavobacterium sp. GA093]|uniref:DUF2931 family protein n=1 Tax=Flavobacterium hydrocarbonoxydans TaxID=2683249 RepID=A0A6I4NYR9_9FLAO|nr:DUF2931 family protein [Flavobacterium hydrocarbonoxydans]MWB96124.1 DUF2931 family protein [Flavobacterium hydrocarbonoxydans]
MKVHKSYPLFLLLLLSLLCCQPKDKFDWNAGISAPKNYIAGGPFVEYFYKGKSLAGASSNVGINPGWEIRSGGYVGSDKYKEVPDSVAVSWRCGFDLIEYKGGNKLPKDKMVKLFKDGVIDSYGNLKEYSVITAGMAPGGNVTIWMQGGNASTIVQKFKADSIGKTDKYNSNSVTLWTSKGTEAKVILNYISLPGIPYSVWEKGEKEYNYDIGFSSTKELNSLFDIAITGITQDGSYVYSDSQDLVKFNEKHKINPKKLPVQFSVRWISHDQKDWYEGTIILPKNLPNIFIDFQKKYGINSKIVVFIKEQNKNEDNNYGTIFLQNSIQKQEIMKFRLAKFNFDIKDFKVSKYSLPKGFVFPKWEGREPLIFPELDYWQEP